MTRGEVDDRASGLLAWQWAIYPAGHTTRTNLIIHIITVPIFEAGTLSLVAAPLLSPRYAYALLGLALMVGAMAAQGRGHEGEPQPPVRFRGPLDVIARILAEEWIAFPRFVFSGGFVRAWKATTPRG